LTVTGWFPDVPAHGEETRREASRRYAEKCEIDPESCIDPAESFSGVQLRIILEAISLNLPWHARDNYEMASRDLTCLQFGCNVQA